MALTINGVRHQDLPKSRGKTTHTAPERPDFSLDDPDARVRVAHFQYLLSCISHSAFYARLKRKLIPPADGHDGRPYWTTATVRQFLQTWTRRRWEKYRPRTALY